MIAATSSWWPFVRDANNTDCHVVREDEPPASMDVSLRWIHRYPGFISIIPHCDFSNGCELYGITIYSYTSKHKLVRSAVKLTMSVANEEMGH